MNVQLELWSTGFTLHKQKIKGIAFLLPYALYFCLCTVEAYIANKMDPDQTAP